MHYDILKYNNIFIYTIYGIPLFSIWERENLRLVVTDKLQTFIIPW